MPHITLSIPEDLYREMKKHPEVRWSEVARQAIRRYLMSLRDELSGEEILEDLPEDVREALEGLSGWEEHYRGIERADEERLRLLEGG
ncbi:MAG TPA: hypothetical protein ENF83_03240 [Candidatus Korarchaeota archaeon]|nr:hypothetical protein [Candidatus Korarchaeota archaeon]